MELKCREIIPVRSSLEKYMEKRSKELNFMGTVLVAKNDKILLNKGYGFANLEHDIPNSSNTIFRIGSITKSFTATAILILEEQGLLNVNDKLTRFIPDYPDGE